MSATAARQREAPDLDALEAAAVTELEDLHDQRQRLAPEALTSSRDATRLARVEEEIRAAEQRLERIQLARAEGERRTTEAALTTAAQLRADALQRARNLQAERQRLVVEVDEAAAGYAAALRAWDRVTTEQESALRAAGWSGDRSMAARPRPYMVELGLARALRDAGCPRGIIEFQSLSGYAKQPEGRIRPLAELDARPVEAIEAAEAQA